MITEIVLFDLPKGISRKKLLAKYRKSAAKWAQNPDLIKKYYLFDEEKDLGGGIYIWKDRKSALQWHGEDYRKMITEVYGSEPSIQILDTLLTVDNLADNIMELDDA